MLRCVPSGSIIHHKMKSRSLTVFLATATAIVCLDSPPRAGQYAPLPSPQNEHVRAELIADIEAIVPGRPFTIGLRLEIEETWHVNWINPGDAGLAPSLEWSLPEGFVAGNLMWPHPWRYPTGPLVIFGYAREVIIYARVTPPADLSEGRVVHIGVQASWLACQDVCVPGQASLTLDIPVADAEAPGPRSGAFLAARARVPMPSQRWRVEGWYQDDYTIVLEMQSSSSADPVLEEVFFFPYEQGIIENAASQKLTRAARAGHYGGYRLEIARSRTVRANPERLTGVIVSKTGWQAGESLSAIAVDILLHPSPR